LGHFVDPDELRHDVFAARFLIHPFDKRRRKTVLLAKKDSDFFHEKMNRRLRGFIRIFDAWFSPET